ncbi:hypothetical protein ACG1BZ_15470 [Microbulbifer sp. CNSA002]|uniref:hypothetical protein n=1 Tax=Microbulbifer sp. CNSA002 TaxID=3373604 RepID=UPI0039B45D41
MKENLKSNSLRCSWIGQSGDASLDQSGFQKANFSIGVGEVAGLANLANELDDDFARDAKLLSKWIRKNEDHKDNAPLLAVLVSIGYIDRKNIDSYRFLLENNPSNNLELGAMTQEAMRGLRSSWATKHLKTVAKQYGDLQWKYFPGGGKFDPGKQL